MRGINDQAEHARLLAKRLNHYGDDWAHVNPIPLNPDRGISHGPHPSPRMSSSSSISCTVPESRPPCVTPAGSDIDGACGQLAAKTKEAFAA